MEITVSRLLSRNLSSHPNFFVFAVKHPCQTLLNIIQNQPTAYLSHPISEVRRLQDGGKIDEAEILQKELNKFIKCFSSTFTLFQPTTIDEYRIMQLDIINNVKHFPVLKPRWDEDYYNFQNDNILYSSSKPKDSDITWVLQGDEINNYLQYKTLQHSLNSRIGFQVTKRDFSLVEQSKYLIVFRPVFNGNISNGVQEEKEYHFKLFETLKSFQKKTTRPSNIFMYCPKDDIIKLIEIQIQKRISYLLENNLISFKDAQLKNVTTTNQQIERIYTNVISANKNDEKRFKDNLCTIFSEIFVSNYINLKIEKIKSHFPKATRLPNIGFSEAKPLSNPTMKQLLAIVYVESFLESIGDVLNYIRDSSLFDDSGCTYEEFLDKIKKTFSL